jgi:hypothetical protein
MLSVCSEAHSSHPSIDVSPRWDVDTPIPLALLTSLNDFLPECRLEIPRRPGKHDAPEALAYLAKSPGLPSLGVRVALGDLISFLRDVKKSSQKLRKLILKNNFMTEPPGEMGELRGESILSLEEVELNRFIPRQVDEETWQSLLDWSVLTKLRITSASFLPVLQFKLPRLKCLKFLDYAEEESDTAESAAEKVKAFLYACDRLEELDLETRENIMDKRIVTHLSRSLKTVRLKFGKRYGVPLPVRTIGLLGQHCSRLEEVSLLVLYTGVWVCLILCAAVSLSPMFTLTVRSLQKLFFLSLRTFGLSHKSSSESRSIFQNLGCPKEDRTVLKSPFPIFGATCGSKCRCK